MSKLQIIPESSTWNDVRKWVKEATQFQHASLACQVMAGFALAELKKSQGIKQGTRTELVANFPNRSGSWGELCRKEAGISDDTANNWIAMAAGIKSRWKKLPVRDRLRALMELPPSAWAETDMKLIADATHKCTDGLTQMEFMIELGMSKGAKAGRKPGCDAGGNDTRLDPEKAAARARQDCEMMIDMIANTPDDKFKKFCPIGDLTRLMNIFLAQAQELKTVLNERKRTL